MIIDTPPGGCLFSGPFILGVAAKTALQVRGAELYMLTQELEDAFKLCMSQTQ